MLLLLLPWSQFRLVLVGKHNLCATIEDSYYGSLKGPEYPMVIHKDFGLDRVLDSCKSTGDDKKYMNSGSACACF